MFFVLHTVSAGTGRKAIAVDEDGVYRIFGGCPTADTQP